MARVFPFRPYRYTAKAGRLDDLVTQPYDKITRPMRERYLQLNPYNLVRIILGESSPADDSQENVYTRAKAYWREWTGNHILARDPEPAIYAYFQEFREPDSGQTLVRQGFIALGAVEDYSAGVVHRHEQTLSGPKKDRLELLRHTGAHFGQIFMLYPDPEGAIDGVLQQASCAPPLCEVTDEYGAVHRLWRIADPALTGHVQELMAPKKLLIADGHHRYETALAFRDENPSLPAASRVMMTFVNMHSPGLKILATHRLVSGIRDFNAERFLARAASRFRIRQVESSDALREAWAGSEGSRPTLGVAIGERLFVLEAAGPDSRLEVTVLHEDLLEVALGIDANAVREERNVRYLRGLDFAIEQARQGGAQAAFLLRPVSVEQVARIAFSGGVMPQKSTDFYPKLLSGLTVYQVED